MEEDVCGYVNACPVCNQKKTSCHPPAGLLHPLPVPLQPWSHISLNFNNSLFPLKGHTAILKGVKLVDKMAHFIPLKLPSAKEIAKLTMSPSDINSLLENC